MPYILASRRADFFKLESLITQTRIDSPGELNYLITQCFLRYIAEHRLRYQSINDCVGAAEGAKLELYRRIAANLEDDKAKEGFSSSSFTSSHTERPRGVAEHTRLLSGWARCNPERGYHAALAARPIGTGHRSRNRKRWFDSSAVAPKAKGTSAA